MSEFNEQWEQIDGGPPQPGDDPSRPPMAPATPRRVPPAGEQPYVGPPYAGQPHAGQGIGGGSSGASGMAITSMVLGIVSLVSILTGCLCIPFALLAPLTGVPGLVLGLVDWRKTAQAGRPRDGMATAGVVCSGAAMALVVLGVLAGLALALMSPNGGAVNFQPTP